MLQQKKDRLRRYISQDRNLDLPKTITDQLFKQNPKPVIAVEEPVVENITCD